MVVIVPHCGSSWNLQLLLGELLKRPRFLRLNRSAEGWGRVRFLMRNVNPLRSLENCELHPLIHSRLIVNLAQNPVVVSKGGKVWSM